MLTNDYGCIVMAIFMTFVVTNVETPFMIHLFITFAILSVMVTAIISFISIGIKIVYSHFTVFPLLSLHVFGVFIIVIHVKIA